MDIQRFRYFLSVARHLNFTRAARDHHVSQPAMSLQIRALEAELGVPLFVRRGRTVELTPAGRHFRSEAAEVVARLERATAEIARFQDVLTGSLRIGTIDMASIHYLPGTFRVFREEFPGIDLFVEVDATGPLAEEVLSGALDLAVTSLPFEHPRLVSIELFEDPLIPVVHARHPLAGRRRVSPEELSAFPMIAHHSGSVTRGLIDRMLAASKTSPRVVMEIDSPAAIVRLVEAGLGTSLVPERSVEKEIASGSLVALATRPPHLIRKIGILARRDLPLSPSAGEFARRIERDHGVDLSSLYAERG